MPLSVLGWPERTPGFHALLPDDRPRDRLRHPLLLGGPDDHVRRLVRRTRPYGDVVIHGLVRDEKGQQDVEDEGNVIDPLEMCDEYGADAVRFTLAILSGTGRDLPFGKTRVAGYRAFATKVWNAARFALGCSARVGPRRKTIDFTSLGTVDRWILSRLSAAVTKVNASLESLPVRRGRERPVRLLLERVLRRLRRDGEARAPRRKGPEAEKAKTRAVSPPRPPRLSRDAPPLHAVRLLRDPRRPERRRDDAAGRAVSRRPTRRGTTARRLGGRDDPAAATRIRNLRAERGLAQTEALAAGLEVSAGPLATSSPATAPSSSTSRVSRRSRSRRRSACGGVPRRDRSRGPRRVAPVKELGPESGRSSRRSSRSSSAEVEGVKKRSPTMASSRAHRPRSSRRTGSSSRAGGAARTAGGEPRPGGRALKRRIGDGCGAALAPRLAGPLRRPPLPFLANVLTFESLPSTNEFGKILAERMLGDGTELRPTVIVARRQTAGRGRSGRVWTDLGDSGLSLSLLLPWPEGPERVRLPITLGVLLAAASRRRTDSDVG